MKKNKKSIYLILSIYGLTVLMLAFTYAWWAWISEEDVEVTFSVDGLNITSTNANVSGTVYPTNNMNNGVVEEFTMIQNSSEDITVCADLTLTLSDFPEELKHESFKYKIYRDSTAIGNGSFEKYSEGDIITIATSQPIITTLTTYKIYIWIDGENYNNPTKMGGKSFLFKINITASQTQECNPSIIDEGIKITSNIGDFSRRAYTVTTNCTNADSYFEPKTWTFEISNLTNSSECNANFTIDNTQYPTLFKYIKTLWNETDGTNNIYEETHTVNGYDYTEYRYEGADTSVNNYIWFNNELWRIIGAFPKGTPTTVSDDGTVNLGNGAPSINDTVKIIRADEMGSFAWDTAGKNDWTTASLNTNILNDLYLSSSSGTCGFYGTTVSKPCSFANNGLASVEHFIENVTWYLGGTNTLTSKNSITLYQLERGNTVYSGRPIITTGKVGIMYPSDFGYAAPGDTCQVSTTFDKYNSCSYDNWITKYGYEWVLTPRSDNNTYAFNVNYYANFTRYTTNRSYNIRPVLYLKSNVVVTNSTTADGSITNPYIVTLQ